MKSKKMLVMICAFAAVIRVFALVKNRAGCEKRAALLHHADFGGDGDQDKRAEIYHCRFFSEKSGACARQRPREDGAFGAEAVSGIKKILFIAGDLHGQYICDKKRPRSRSLQYMGGDEKTLHESARKSKQSISA